MGWLQLLAVNNQAADRGWCPAPTPRSGTQVLNSANNDEAGTSVKEVDSWRSVHHCHNLYDMALYSKAVQRVDARPYLKGKVLPRLGELHVVMRGLRALGSSIENSGIDDAWMEADVYGSATTRHIIKCTHYKRSLRAHIYSYIALYELAIDQFLKENLDLKDVGLEANAETEEACSVAKRNTKAESVEQANAHPLQTLNQENVLKRLHDWEEQKAKNAMFRSMMNYLHRGETILHFVAASRNADLLAQLSACATHIVKTTKTHTTRIVIQMMTVMTNVICLIYLHV